MHRLFYHIRNFNELFVADLSGEWCYQQIEKRCLSLRFLLGMRLCFAFLNLIHREKSSDLCDIWPKSSQWLSTSLA